MIFRQLLGQYTARRKDTKSIELDNTNDGLQEEQDGEWRGWADWLGVVNVWTRTTLLAFLEDLRPHLEHLEEKDLYAIISQSGAMPGLVQAFGKDKPGKLIQDLRGNGGRGVEETLKKATEGELEEAALSGVEYSKDGLEVVPESTAPPEEYLAHEEKPLLGREEGGLPTLITGEGLRAVDALAALHYGLDDETAEFLVQNRVAALWNAYINDGPGPVEEALTGEGGHYFGLIRSRFYRQLRAVENLPVPGGLGV